MKKIYNFSILSIIIVLLAASCNSASKAYKNGDYYRATINAIDKLRSKPNNEKAQKVLLDAYPLAQKQLCGKSTMPTCVMMSTNMTLW